MHLQKTELTVTITMTIAQASALLSVVNKVGTDLPIVEDDELAVTEDLYMILGDNL
jgi:hypothetical protein